MQHIAEWLEDIGLSEYSQRFVENGIDISVLPHLTDQDLKELGILLGHRRKILAAVGRPAIAPASPAPASPSEPQPREIAERRQVTVLFSDMVGSTALSTRLDPEDLREIISSYQNCVTQIIRRSGGFVARYMGDGVLAYFGYPEAHEEDAERAVRTGLELVAAVCELKTLVALQTRVGIATGMVVVGDLIETDEARERGIVGETPNLAARLQGVAEPGMVVIAESTREQLGRLFDLEELEAKDLKGIPKPVTSWAVLRAGAAESRFEALHAGTMTFVGREAEIELLKRYWRLAKSGETRVVQVSAEAGLGKSHLVATFAEQLRSEPHTILQFFCAPHTRDSALFPIIACLERAAGFKHEDTPEAKRNKIETLLTSSSDVAEDVHLIAELLALPRSDDDRAMDYSPQRTKEKTLDALLRYVVGAARRQPVLLIFEDVHWIDPTSREWLDLAVRQMRQLPVLALVTSRTEFQSSWAGQSHVTSLPLPRLSPEDSVTLVRQIERTNAPLSEGVVQEIIDRSDGVPLFLEQVTRAVLEVGDANVVRNGSTPSAPDRRIPSTLQASLIGRLDRLGKPAKEIAQLGAAIGREFSYNLLAAASQRPPVYLEDALARLVEKELILQSASLPEATFLFKHALVQDAAYSTLLRTSRRDIHARIATAMLSRGTADSAAPEIVAFHLQQAGRPAEAIAYWRKAGEQCARRANNREAAAHFRRALALLERHPQASDRLGIELAILSQLAPALMSVYGWGATEVGEVVERATEVGHQLDSSQEVAPSIANLWLFHYANGRLDAAEKVSRDLHRIARDLDSQEVLLQAHHTAWPVRWGRGAMKDALGHIDAGLALYDEQRHAHHRFLYLGHDPAVCGLAIASQLCSSLGYAAQAKDRGDQALALARRLNHEPTLMHGLWFVIESQMTRSDVFGVTANTAELLNLAEQYGLPLPRAMGLIYRGWALAYSGKAEEGLALATEGTGLLQRTGNQILLSRAYGVIAEIHLMTGRYQEGLSEVERAIHVASNIGEFFYMDRLLLNRALLMRETGQAEEAVEAGLKRSLEFASLQGAKALELRTAIHLANLWGHNGKRDQAQKLLRSTCDRFTEGHDTPDFKRASEMLHGLEDQART
ncbi:AAA family ATPase [Bradyrhizobium jicamae]|uniref:adenylate/guanylate cyclase domain-containing protein n=1 Tax=Bradyrhizobium jicamae TaxID=280332 RepID=UPI001BA58CB1|nr:adenylate/guanylate cyclase domain-containing protein [Bradyrhizobium jicamae]MBR0757094.1 AAA family ATPase [Bradyrhizobium jicamae]